MKKLFAAFAIVTVAALTSCSKTDEPAVVTLPENAPTTSTPNTLAPSPDDDPGADSEPLELLWVAQAGGPGDDTFTGLAQSSSFNPDPQSGPVDVIAVGSTSAGLAASLGGAALGAQDVMTARISAEGKILATEVIGSSGDDIATSATTVFNAGGVEPGADALAIACGFTTGDMAGPPLGAEDGWCGPVASRNPSPDADQPEISDDDLARLFGFTTTPFASEAREQVTAVAAVDPDDRSGLAQEQGMYLAANIDGIFPGAGDPANRGLGQGDALAFRTSLRSGTSWIRQFGTPLADAITGVCTSDGNGYYVGWTEGDLGGRSNGGRDAWISMIDKEGWQRWLIQFGYPGNEEFKAVTPTGDPAAGTQQFIAVGATDGDGPSISSGGKDALIASFAPDGSTLWALQLGGEGDDEATAVVASESIIYVAGTTSSAAATPERSAIEGIGDLDDSIGPGGGKDGFLTAVDGTTGSVLWTTRFGSSADDTISSATITLDGLLVVAGSTAGSLGEHTSAGGRDGFAVAFQLPPAGGGAQSLV